MRAVFYFSGSIYTMDTLSISLNSANVTNIYGYSLDGDGDGNPGDDISFLYTTLMLADYDSSGAIEVGDLSRFVSEWDQGNTYLELGPFVGNVPHLSVQPDGQYNIEDIMGFIMEGNWSLTNSNTALVEWDTFGESILLEGRDDSLFISIPSTALAYEVQIKYDPQAISFTLPQDLSDIQLSHDAKERGLLTLMAAGSDNESISIPAAFRSSKHHEEILVSFRAMGSDNDVVTQITKQAVIEYIPREFALHQNYPNPFNPNTTIVFEVPESSHIRLDLYDLLGRHVRTLVNEEMPIGLKTIVWDSLDERGIPVAAGIYFYKMEAGTFSKTMKMILLK